MMMHGLHAAGQGSLLALGTLSSIVVHENQCDHRDEPLRPFIQKQTPIVASKRLGITLGLCLTYAAFAVRNVGNAMSNSNVPA